MKSWLKIGISCLGAAVLAAGPSLTAAAAADTGWTKSKSLYEVHTLAGSNMPGFEDGVEAKATLFHPDSIVELADGRLLVADRDNHLLRLIANGEVTTYGGIYLDSDASGNPLGAYHDDTIARSAFNEPAGMAVGPHGDVYVADEGNNAIRRIAPDGTVTTLAGNGLIGADDGKGQAARFNHPSDVAVDAEGNVYVADTLNNAIRKIAADGMVTTLNASSKRVVEYTPGVVDWAGEYADGLIASAKFNEPSGLALDAKGNLYVSDRGNQRIRYIDFAAGSVTTVAGTAPAYGAKSPYAEGGYADGAALSARFNAPEGLAVTPDGALIVADSLNHAIRMLKGGQVTTLAGAATEHGAVDGVTNAARFDHPADVAVLSDGTLAIADEYGNKVRVLTKYAKPEGMKADGKIRTLLNGVLVKSDVPAFQRKGATLLPLRSVGKALGYEVSYDAKTHAGILKKDGVTYKVKSGDTAAAKTAGGQTSPMKLNGAPVMKDGRLFVPVRFFADEAGLDVQWDAAASIVVLRNSSVLGNAPATAQAQAASLRTAIIKELSGDVTVRLAGGSAEYQAYAAMRLNQGDVLVTGEDGSATLVFSNGTEEDDTITVAPNTMLTFSKLSDQAGSVTNVSVLKGTVWSDVRSIKSEEDQFQIETPTGVMSARGTHYLVSVDPVTGLLHVDVAAGVVDVQPTGVPGNQGKSVNLYPTQQISLDGRDQGSELESKVTYLDPNRLVTSTPPSVIAAIIKSGSEIQQENSKFVEEKVKQQGGLDPTAGMDPDQYLHNLESLMGSIAKDAVSQDKLSQEGLQKLVDEANQDSQAKGIGKVQLTPDAYQLTDEQLKAQQKVEKTQEELQRQAEEEIVKRQQQTLENLLNQIIEATQRLKETNESIKNESKKQAEETFLNSLDEQDRERFLEDQKQAAEQTRQQVSVPSGPTAPSGPTTPTDPGEPPVQTNHAPTDMSVSETVYEGEPEAGTEIGALSATDADVGDTFVFSLIDGYGGTDNGKFAIEGSRLVTADPLEAGTYHILVKVTDAGGLSFQKAFEITVTPDETADDIARLDSLILTVGSTPQEVTLADHTYTFEVDQSVHALGVTAAAAAGGTLTVNGTLATDPGSAVNVELYDGATDIVIVVTAKDGMTTSTYTIKVRHRPAKITFSPIDGLDGKAGHGTTVGTLAATDPDGEGDFTYSLVADENDLTYDNDKFEISDDRLIAKDDLGAGTYTLVVEATDEDGLSTQKPIAVPILPVGVEQWDTLVDGQSVKWYSDDAVEGELTYSLFLDSASSLTITYQFADGVEEEPILDAFGQNQPLETEQAGTIAIPGEALHSGSNDAYVHYSFNGDERTIHLIVDIGEPNLQEISVFAENVDSMWYPSLYPTGSNAFSTYITPEDGSTLHIESSTWGDQDITTSNEPSGQDGYTFNKGWNSFGITLYYPDTHKIVSQSNLTVLVGEPGAEQPALLSLNGVDDQANETVFTNGEDNPLAWSGMANPAASSVNIHPVAADGWSVAGVYDKGEYLYDMNSTHPADDDGNYSIPLTDGEANLYIVLSDGEHSLTYSVQIYPFLI